MRVTNYERRAPSGAYVRQGKETGYLVGTREVLRDDRMTGTAGVRSVRTLLVVRTLKQSDQR